MVAVFLFCFWYSFFFSYSGFFLIICYNFCLFFLSLIWFYKCISVIYCLCCGFKFSYYVLESLTSFLKFPFSSHSAILTSWSFLWFSVLFHKGYVSRSSNEDAHCNNHFHLVLVVNHFQKYLFSPQVFSMIFSRCVVIFHKSHFLSFCFLILKQRGSK